MRAHLHAQWRGDTGHGANEHGVGFKVNHLGHKTRPDADGGKGQFVECLQRWRGTAQAFQRQMHPRALQSRQTSLFGVVHHGRLRQTQLQVQWAQLIFGKARHQGVKVVSGLQKAGPQRHRNTRRRFVTRQLMPLPKPSAEMRKDQSTNMLADTSRATGGQQIIYKIRQRQRAPRAVHPHRLGVDDRYAATRQVRHRLIQRHKVVLQHGLHKTVVQGQFARSRFAHRHCKGHHAALTDGVSQGQGQIRQGGFRCLMDVMARQQTHSHVAAQGVIQHRVGVTHLNV